jgi:hypothetical protein
MKAKIHHGVLLLGASGFFRPALASAFGSAAFARTHSMGVIEGGIWFDARASKITDFVAELRPYPSAAIAMLGKTSIDACTTDPQGVIDSISGATRCSAQRSQPIFGVMRHWIFRI